ncbi:MAG: hypothetical protein FP831_02425 [Anaerolineae bacterium]|nr:hypothetical protein [Anaerolineae bacterium]
MDNNNENPVVPEVVTVNPVQPAEKTHKRSSSRLFGPFILIMVGLILLFKNLDLVDVNLNWWAAFIFIPVFGSLATGINAFQKSGKFDGVVRSSIGSMIVVGTVATILLFDMDWSRFWPLMLIAPGLSALINGISIADVKDHPTAAKWAGLSLWFGLALILLGVGFLAKFMPIPAIENLLFHRWWAIPILIPGVGAFINALVICAGNGFKASWLVWGFSLIGVAFTATGLFALYNLNWNLLGPIILIAGGLVVLSGLMTKK